jgi:hypothetical protein
LVTVAGSIVLRRQQHSSCNDFHLDGDRYPVESSRRILSGQWQGSRGEHGMTLYELDAKGERLPTRYAPGYFQMMADFIKSGRIGNHYGGAEITMPIKLD